MRTRDLRLAHLLPLALLALAAARPATGQPCTITCPPTLVHATEPDKCGAVVTFPAPPTSGSCGAVTASPPSGSFFPLGATSVVVGTAAGPSCVFTVLVNDPFEPTMSCSPDLTVEATGALTPVSFGVTASDSCDLGEIHCDPPIGSGFPVGTTTVVCSASDRQGNIGVCSFKVNVVAPTAPTETASETGVIFPNPLTSISIKTSFGPYTVYGDVGPADALLVFKDGVYERTVLTPGFFIRDMAPTDTGIAAVGQNVPAGRAQLAILDLGGENPTPIYHNLPPATNLSQSVRVEGNFQGDIAIAPIFNRNILIHWSDMPDGEVVPYDLPAGARLQDHLVFAPDLVQGVTTGVNTVFQIPRNRGPLTFTTLPFTPGSLTYTPEGTNLVSDAFNPVIHEIGPNGQEIRSFSTKAPTFLLSTLPSEKIVGVQLPRNLMFFDRKFNLEGTYTMSGNDTFVDYRPETGFPTRLNVDLFNPTAARGIVRRVGLDDLPLSYLRKELLRDFDRDFIIRQVSGR